MKFKKTNAMRKLEQLKIDYESINYDPEEEFDANKAYQYLDDKTIPIFKTIVLEQGTDHFVVVIPLDAHISMKKAAQAFGVKKVALLHLKELLNLTGYVRGGCSPIGMKKLFPTILDTSALDYEKILVSGGRRGSHIIINPQDLADSVNASFHDVLEV